MRNYIFSLLGIFGFNENTLASDFPPNVNGNRHVIQELLKHGSNSNKLHPLEHHFYSNSHESLRALMEKAKVLVINRRKSEKALVMTKDTGMVI